MTTDAWAAMQQATRDPAVRLKLTERFLVPPFSVLDARQGYWQERKEMWLGLGIQSELGRGDNAPDGGHSDQSINIDFYARKRALETEAGREMTTDEARNILVERGEIRHVDRSNYNAAGKKFAGGLANGLHALREAQKAGTELPEYAGQEQSGTSIFDPVLCELAYRWFCPPEGSILDPFAGGSVRGIVASILGMRYTGIDLSIDQIEANRQQAAQIIPDAEPEWIEGDGLDAIGLAPGQYDFIFSCPPYGDLEVYTNHPRDLSCMDWPEFLDAYRAIIARCVSMLKPDRFACFVVGDFRDGKGFYRNFVSETIRAFLDAGTKLYNEAVLLTAIGSLPIRVGKQFEAGRKLGKTHQNVLVFVKGDPKLATRVMSKEAHHAEPA